MTFLRNAILVLVVASASWSAHVEAQRGCVGMMGLCELRNLCAGDEDCTTGSLCDGGFCVTGSRCIPCCVEVPGAPSVLSGATCTYQYPCGIVVNPTSTARAQPTTCFQDGNWDTGDCDGDGSANGPLVSFDRANCAQLAAISDGDITHVDGSLATSCAATNAVDLGDETCGYTPTPSVRLIGNACGEATPCEGRGRCVIDEATAQGVCVYPGVDAGRLTATDVMDCFDNNACIARLAGVPASFANGDCDDDGLINRVDPDICEHVRAVNVTLDTNEVLVSSSAARPLSPVHRTVDPGFAFDCSRGLQHCPIIDDGSEELVRCVALPAEVNASVCTYGLGFIPDNSCLAPGVMFSRAACAFEGSRAYESWAAGDCDGDDIVNKDDLRVCEPAIASDDAGVSDDAGPQDADVSEAGPTSTDAATDDVGRVSFSGGGGCACRAQTNSPSHGWMLVLFAFAPMLRRRRTRPA